MEPFSKTTRRALRSAPVPEKFISYSLFQNSKTLGVERQENNVYIPPCFNYLTELCSSNALDIKFLAPPSRLQSKLLVSSPKKDAQQARLDESNYLSAP